MDKAQPIIVNIINRNYPPGPGITGESANELAEFLIQKEIVVNVIHINALYEGAGSATPFGNVFSIKTFYNGKNKLLRLFSNLYEGLALLVKSNSLNPDVTICLTDPPLLNFWASLLLRKKKWILWTMDLYPEAFNSGNLASKKNIFYKLIDKIVKKHPPAHFITLGPVQSNYIREKYREQITITEIPCGIFQPKTHDNILQEKPLWATEDDKIYLGYCGNLGEAHSLRFLYECLNNFDPEKHVFILSVYGLKAKEALAYAKDRKGVKVLSSVNKIDLKYIDVHLASLKEEWINVCVPSKTVSSVCAGSAFLYCGLPQSDNWQLLHDAGWIIDAKQNISIAVKHFLDGLSKEELDEKKQKARKISGELNCSKQEAFRNVCQTIIALSALEKPVKYPVNVI
ncbi:MAG TPA: hypothetical protein VFW07_11535 [Parafilimonas sp.]|nr:hypothetical protein [Parafilimonas sp.]